jgi:hypothetical protein
MDLQTRKLNIIEYLIGLKDENIFKVIEDVINQSKTGKELSYSPFTQKELIERAKKSNEDYPANR